MLRWPVISHLTGVKYGEKAFVTCADFVTAYVKDHRRNFNPDNLKDLTDVFLAKIDETSDPASSFYAGRGEKALINNLIDLFFAGMETVSSSLLWSLLYLLHYPSWQDRIHREIDSVIGQNRLPTLNDRAKLHETNAFLLESLRLTSFVPMSVFHYTSAPVPLKNYVIPPDCMLLTSLYHVMHDPVHFPEPHRFKPERFLDEQGHFTGHDRVIPFGLGRRLCLGISLADKELYLFFAGFMQLYSVYKVPGVDPPPFGQDDVPVTGLTRTVPMFDLLLKKR